MSPGTMRRGLAILVLAGCHGAAPGPSIDGPRDCLPAERARTTPFEARLLAGCEDALRTLSGPQEPISAGRAHLLLARAAVLREDLRRLDLVPTDAGEYLIARRAGLVDALETWEGGRARRRRMRDAARR